MTVQPCSPICFTSRIRESDILESNPLVGSSSKSRVGFLGAKKEWNQQHNCPGNATQIPHTGKLCLDRGSLRMECAPGITSHHHNEHKIQHITTHYNTEFITTETKKSSPQQGQRHIGALPLTTRDATDESWGTHHRVATFLQVQLLDDTWNHQSHQTSEILEGPLRSKDS